jgi:hypothetical protein
MVFERPVEGNNNALTRVEATLVNHLAIRFVLPLLPIISLARLAAVEGV